MSAAKKSKPKIKIDEVSEQAPLSKSPKGKRVRSPNRSPKPIDSTFELLDINMTEIDRKYMLPEIIKKQERDQLRKKDKSDDMKQVTTSLIKLGISDHKKEPDEVIAWGEHLKIDLYMTRSTHGLDSAQRIDPDNAIRVDDMMLPEAQRSGARAPKVKCSHCHQYPPPGAIMLAVPFTYVPSFKSETVYTPDCVNVVDKIDVEPHHQNQLEKRKDVKNAPRINYFKRDVPSHMIENYDKDRITTKEYFECAYPVCSFSCMVAKGTDLSCYNPKFRDVNMLIYFLYEKIFEKSPKNKLVAAGSFMLLEEYGGSLTLEKYRKDFRFVTVSDTSQFYIDRIIKHAEMLFHS